MSFIYHAPQSPLLIVFISQKNSLKKKRKKGKNSYLMFLKQLDNKMGAVEQLRTKKNMILNSKKV